MDKDKPVRFLKLADGMWVNPALVAAIKEENVQGKMMAKVFVSGCPTIVLEEEAVEVLKKVAPQPSGKFDTYDGWIAAGRHVRKGAKGKRCQDGVFRFSEENTYSMPEGMKSYPTRGTEGHANGVTDEKKLSTPSSAEDANALLDIIASSNNDEIPF